MDITKIPGDPARIYNPDDYFYMLTVYLTDDAYEQFATIKKSAQETIYYVDDIQYNIKNVHLSTEDNILINDAPTIEPTAPGYALLIKRDLQEAFKAAQAICPPKAPREVILFDDLMIDSPIDSSEAMDHTRAP